MTSIQPSPDLNAIAEAYVMLILGIGQHDADYVDAYFGPTQWREEAIARAESKQSLLATATGILARLRSFKPPADEKLEAFRHRYLVRQVESAIARLNILEGQRLTFEEEAQALYDATPPVYSAAFFQNQISQLDSLLDGVGSVAERYEKYRAAFILPKDRLDTIFRKAIAECRDRTSRHIALPANEQFTLEYVANKPWSGYNWYKGSATSLIQINTDLPIYIDRAVDLAAHEGYPGHHVYNTLLETHLARERGWHEFTIYALFSPQSLVAEGTANFGIEVAFPGEERVTFEKEMLFPLAGLPAAETGRYYALHRLTTVLNYAHNEAARGYLNGAMSRGQAQEWLIAYALITPERAAQRLRFIDAYRSYVINYNLGQDLVRQYIESRGGVSADPSRRWEEFAALISSPCVPSQLIVQHPTQD